MITKQRSQIGDNKVQVVASVTIMTEEPPTIGDLLNEDVPMEAKVQGGSFTWQEDMTQEEVDAADAARESLSGKGWSERREMYALLFTQFGGQMPGNVPSEEPA